MRDFVIVGKLEPESPNGPGLIIRGFIEHFESDKYNLIPLLFNNAYSKRSYLKQLRKTILNTRNAVINVHTDGYLIPLFVYLFSNLNKSNDYYLTVHGIGKIEERYTNVKRQLLSKFLEPYIYRSFPKLVCVSNMERDDILYIYHQSSNVIVIPNATDARSQVIPSFTEHELKIVMLGGLKNRKGIWQSLQLFKKMKETGMAFIVDIYGSEEGNLVEFNKYLILNNLIDNVYFHGIEKDKQKIYDIISASDISLNLSLYDTFNTAIAESLVLGCPCVCSSRCGASYLINENKNDAGLVVDINNNSWIDECLIYIIPFVNNPQKRMAVYNNRIYYQKKLSWKETIKAYLSLGDLKG